MADSSGMRPGLKGNIDEALRLFAMEAEWSGLNLAETEFVLEEALKCYGSIADASQVRNLFAFYRRYLGMADVGRRQGLLTRITEFVSDGRQNRYQALLCFLNADSDGQIISGAALDVAMVMPQESGDPLTGPKHVALHSCGGLRAKMGRPGSDDEGYAAAGLLLLGDMRLLPMLEEIWERLTPEARRRMVQRRSNLVSALMVEFLLRRLEADKAEEYFGELGAALHNLPEIAAQLPISAVMDIRRNFGLPVGKEPMELLGRETLAEAFTRIRPRLEALIARESEPKVLPAALAVWAAAAGVEIEEDSEDAEEDEYSGDEGDEDADDDDVEIKTRVLAQDLHDEFDLFVNEDELPPEICYYENPYVVRDLTAKDVKSALSPQKFLPLLVTGIFNPFGPTVCVYGVQRTRHDDWMLLRFQLNPFSCTMGPVALMDLEKTFFATGDFDEKESARKKILVAHGRTTPSLDVTHDILTRIALGKSRLQASFSLCVSSARISKQKSLERIAVVYQAAPKARQELEDLRDKKKRNDPWARADMAEAMRRIDTSQPEPAPLTPKEAAELAAIVLDPNQQRIEMANILAAWEGATGFCPLSPVMTKNQFLEAIVMLTTDMPNLVNHSGPFHSDDLTRDVPKGASKTEAQMVAAAGVVPAKAAEKVKDMESPDEEERTMTPAEKIAAAMATPPVPKDETTYPKFDGLLGCLGTLSGLELMLGFWAIVWALICTEWVLAAALAAFFLLQFLKVGLIVSRISWSRWFAVFNYGWLLAYLAYRIDRHNSYAQPMTGAGLLLVQIMTVTAGVMGLVYLGYFRFAKTMRESPEVKN